MSTHTKPLRRTFRWSFWSMGLLFAFKFFLKGPDRPGFIRFDNGNGICPNTYSFFSSFRLLSFFFVLRSIVIFYGQSDCTGPCLSLFIVFFPTSYGIPATTGPPFFFNFTMDSDQMLFRGLIPRGIFDRTIGVLSIFPFIVLILALVNELKIFPQSEKRVPDIIL